MPCNHPIAAWWSSIPGKQHKQTVTFTYRDGERGGELYLPCGKCMGCRIDRKREWATRLMHEAKLWPSNYFATLTYNDEHLPEDYGLRPRDFVLFMKRFRKKHSGLRFFQVGEYGDETRRPHHHALLFNCQLYDLKGLPRARDAHALYTSKELEQAWGQGNVSVGDVTYQSAAYVASYVTKRVTGEKAAEHYQGRQPEYCTMSRRPGIAHDFLIKYKQNLYDYDETVTNGKPSSLPRYYDRLLAKEDDDQLASTRMNRTLQPRINRTPRQKHDREETLVAEALAKAKGTI